MAWILLCVVAIFLGGIISLIWGRVKQTNNAALPSQPTTSPPITNTPPIGTSTPNTPTTSIFSLKYSHSSPKPSTNQTASPSSPTHEEPMSAVSYNRINETLKAIEGLASNQTGSAICRTIVSSAAADGLDVKATTPPTSQESGSGDSVDEYEYDYDYSDSKPIKMNSPEMYQGRETYLGQGQILPDRYILGQGFDNTIRFITNCLQNLSLPVISQSFSFNSTELNCDSQNLFTAFRGSSNQTILVGAHSDSVMNTAGINDNGSGVAALLEAIKVLQELGLEFVQNIVFAFWGAEELTMLGSQHFVTSPEREQILTNLTGNSQPNITCTINLDMLGDLNGGYYVSDSSATVVPQGYSALTPPNGSDVLSALIRQVFSSIGINARNITLFDASDHGPFARYNIPSVFLSAGTGSNKTSEAAMSFGGEANQPHDPCYHQPCDNYGNVDVERVWNMTRVIVDVLVRLATRQNFWEPDPD